MGARLLLLVALAGTCAGCAESAPDGASRDGPAALEGLQTLHVNGVELHYEDRGRGEAVVFVHGGLVDYREWEPVAALIGDEYRTITYSRRYNFPNRNTLSGPDHSAVVEGEDLAELIRALDLGPVHLAGISYGGYTALSTAMRHPDLVRSLTLVEAPLVHWAADMEEGAELYHEFMGMWRASADAFARGDSVAALSAAIDWFVAPGFYEHLPSEFTARLMSNLVEWRALTSSSEAFGPITRADLGALSVPVLMISGGRSYPLFQLVDAELEQHLPDVRRLIVPDGTHDVCSEQAETCARALRQFFTQDAPTPGPGTIPWYSNAEELRVAAQGAVDRFGAQVAALGLDLGETPTVEVRNEPVLIYYDGDRGRIVVPWWDDLGPKERASFTVFAGGDEVQGERVFRALFHRFLIAHEAGHWLQHRGNLSRGSAYENEADANRLAVAYWRTEPDGEAFLEELEPLLAVGVDHLRDPTPPGHDPVTYFSANVWELAEDPMSYGYYQFRFMLDAVRERARLDLEDMVLAAGGDGP
jgi:pimeloyl-ACP methyl ester carboxylesterase